MNAETVLTHYAICALWTSNDESDDTGGEPMDANYSLSDFAPETMQAMRDDVNSFVNKNMNSIIESGQSDAQTGHDFWLTRNGHGVGFWDRGLGEVWETLSTASEHYGNFDLYVGDDGRIYA
jgi:hypothetical protein